MRSAGFAAEHNHRIDRKQWQIAAQRAQKIREKALARKQSARE